VLNIEDDIFDGSIKMKIRRDTRKKLLDLMEDHEKNTRKERLENFASELQVTPELAQNLLDGKELIDDELAKRIDEQLKKHKDDDSNLFDKKRLQKVFRKRIDPGVGGKIDEAWNEKFRNIDEKIIVGDEIKNKIENYGELNFYKKVLTPRDFNSGIYGLQDIYNIPKLGEQVIIIDCNNGEEYPTHIQESQYSIITGLKNIWDKFQRRKVLKQGDIIGIALDPNDNHRIYVDFEYKYREKLDNQKKECKQEDINRYTKYIKYGVAIEKSIPWIKEQIQNSKDGTIIVRTKDIGKEMGPEFEKKNPTSIYWGLKHILRHHDIVVDQDIHDKSGDKLLIMRYITEEDMPQSSPEQYIDGEVLKVPSLKDLEISLEKKTVKKERVLNTKIRNIEHDPEKEMAISLEKRRYAPRNIYGAVRDNSFRDRILDVYKDTCTICGLQMNMVEACHIIPVGNGGTDEIINGIALCHNHHKSFDSGLIFINEEYCIVLNHSKVDDIKSVNVAGGLDDFIKNSRIGEKIFLPYDNKFYPSIDFLIKKRITLKH
jgi:hypothetical protein